MTDEQMADFINNQVNRQNEWKRLYEEQQKSKKAQRAIDNKDNWKKATDKYRASLKEGLSSSSK